PLLGVGGTEERHVVGAVGAHGDHVLGRGRGLHLDRLRPVRVVVDGGAVEEVGQAGRHELEAGAGQETAAVPDRADDHEVAVVVEERVQVRRLLRVLAGAGVVYAPRGGGREAHGRGVVRRAYRS